MRYIIFLVLIFAFAANQGLSVRISSKNIYKFDNVNPAFVNRIFETELNETLECLRYTLETGLPEVGLPSLESIDIPDINLDLDSWNFEGTSGYFHVISGVFRGLTTYYAADLSTALTLDPIGISVDITLVLPEFYLELDYDMDMMVEGISVFGNGKVIIDWTDVTLRLQFYIGIDEIIYMSDVNLYITVGGSQITITGWFNDEEHSQVVTDLVNDYLIPQWINGQTEEISEVLGPLIESLVNSLLDIINEASIGTFSLEDDLNAILDAIVNHCAARSDDTRLFLK